MSGFEANYVNNYGFEKEKRLRGISIYGSKTIAQKLKALARLDYFDPGLLQGAEYNYYLLAGVEFQPGRNFGCALTYRVNTYQIQGVALPQLNVNFGIKF